jgi:HD-like signal output (HDOD) protein
VDCSSGPAIAVLFVDDDRRILDGLRRALHAHRQRIRAHFCESGEAALEWLATNPADAIVSDLRMPGMDGNGLLTEIEKQHPHMMRIVLSGEARSALLARSMGLAHRVIGKPCEPAQIVAITEEALALRRRICSPEVRAAISAVNALPSPPHVFREIEEAIRREASLAEVGAIVGSDPALTTKLLQLANSAWFGGRRSVTSAEQAATFLGLENLKTLILATALQESTRVASSELAAEIESLWGHANEVAALSREIAKEAGRDRTLQSECFSAGMLHDVGRLLIMSQLMTASQRVQRLHDEEGLSIADAERAVLGATHAEIGAHLLFLWGLPDDVVEIACRHEDALGGEEIGFKLLVVTVAALLCGDSMGEPGARQRLEALEPAIQAAGLGDAVATANAGRTARGECSR